MFVMIILGWVNIPLETKEVHWWQTIPDFKKIKSLKKKKKSIYCPHLVANILHNSQAWLWEIML